MNKYNSVGGSDLRLTEQQLEESVSQQYEFEDITYGNTGANKLNTEGDGNNEEPLRLGIKQSSTTM